MRASTTAALASVLCILVVFGSQVHGLEKLKDSLLNGREHHDSLSVTMTAQSEKVNKGMADKIIEVRSSFSPPPSPPTLPIDTHSALREGPHPREHGP